MKFLILLILYLVVPKTLSKLTATKESIAKLEKLATTDIAQEWETKLARRFEKNPLVQKNFKKFLHYLEEITASKADFELMISGSITDSTLLQTKLDKFIEDYRQKGPDTELLNFLDPGNGTTKSFIDDLISLSRNYQKQNSGSSDSSTIKNIFDVFITAFMGILKGNAILDAAIEIKTAISENYFEEERQKNHYRKNEIYKNYFESLKKTFIELKDEDMDGFIDLSRNGLTKSVRMINVLQYFWEYENNLSNINTCSDDCYHFKKRGYTGSGCYGHVNDCKFGVDLYSEERYLRQKPQVDRIYMGYVLNHKWYGKGIDDDKTQDMEHKSSYLRGFYICDVCKCVCDQYYHENTIRKIYAGKISAPDGHVVTGVRFVIHNKAIYPQIEIGKLLSMTVVDPKSVRWLELSNEANFVTFEYDKRALGFGDPSSLVFSDGVVTGVQFKSTSYGASWSIYGRKLIDFNRGALGSTEECVDTSYYLNHFDAHDLIPELKYEQESLIRKNLKITFGISNEVDDAGQSFVPYFDGNEASFEIKAPLSGITLIHYTNHYEYAGYIRPIIRSLDYRKFFSTAYKIEEFVPKN